MARASYSVICLAAVVGLATGAALAGDVVDGDTFELEGQAIRLHGIDAFEIGQTCLDARGMPWRCGVAAKAALAERIQGHTLSCTVIDEDRAGSYVARCTAPDGTDLAAYLVENGLALADRRVSDEYVAEERAARAANAGAWEGAFMPPWEWRRQQAGS